MNKRPDNVFQFLEVERKLPAKVGLVTRKTAFREIYEPVTEESLRDQAHRCLACGNPYCEWRCPVHNLIPDWLRLMAAGEVAAAAGWLNIREYARTSRDTAASIALREALAGRMTPVEARGVIETELLGVYAGDLRKALAEARGHRAAGYGVQLAGALARAVLAARLHPACRRAVGGTAPDGTVRRRPAGV